MPSDVQEQPSRHQDQWSESGSSPDGAKVVYVVFLVVLFMGILPNLFIYLWDLYLLDTRKSASLPQTSAPDLSCRPPQSTVNDSSLKPQKRKRGKFFSLVPNTSTPASFSTRNGIRNYQLGASSPAPRISTGPANQTETQSLPAPFLLLHCFPFRSFTNPCKTEQLAPA